MNIGEHNANKFAENDNSPSRITRKSCACVNLSGRGRISVEACDVGWKASRQEEGSSLFKLGIHGWTKEPPISH